MGHIVSKAAPSPRAVFEELIRQAAQAPLLHSDDTPMKVLLRQRHGIGFEQVVVAVEAGGLVATMVHPNPGRYPRQRIMVLRIDGYAFLVPFVEDEDHIFLKTIIPSRKATRDFIERGSDHEA